MIKIIGDVDWTTKVTQELKGLELSKEMIVIQLDRQDRVTRVYSSAPSVRKALGESTDPTATIVLVGSCPLQDYIDNNRADWAKLPHDRIHFYEAGRNPQPLPKFVKTLRD